MSHSITIVFKDDGTVEGNVDDEVSLSPFESDTGHVQERARAMFDRALWTLFGRQHVSAPQSQSR